MSVEITYFVHGTTTDNERNLATGWLPGELSELGKQQSADLGKIVADKNFDIVFCSDLQRAIDTAKIAFDKFKIVQDQRLRECNYGDFNGGPHSFKDAMDDFVNKPFPNGESYKDVEARIKEFLKMLSDEYKGKHVAIVAHQAPQLAMDVLLKDKTWKQAIAEDWRETKAYQPGWMYTII